MTNKIVTLSSGQKVCLVPRDQLRVKGPHKRARAPQTKGPSDPTPPSGYDFSNGERLVYSILGNDQYGNCYYVCICNGSKTWTGNTGTEFNPDVNAVIARYLQVSGGDNGLDDSLAMPEWLGGVIGPNGPCKILDWMVVPLTDLPTWEFLGWAFGGHVWTCSLLDTWLNATSPGSVWDANGTPDPSAGHAMFRTGRHEDSGNHDTRTWAITPPIQVTPAGDAAADSEFIVAFSVDQFNPSTGLHFSTGLTWDAMRAIWIAHGGKDVGASPFVPTPPTPVPTPVPTPPDPPAPTPSWLNQLLNTIINQLEASEPWATWLLEIVRSLIDQYVSSPKYVGSKYTKMRDTNTVQALVDAFFADMEAAACTQLQGEALKIVQAMIDAWLGSSQAM